jgi:hypothetical protein
LDTCLQYACPIWTRVLNTRVQLDTCIEDTCPFFTAVHFDTCHRRHVSNLTRVYSNGYCRHASKCSDFCSDMGAIALSSNPIYHARTKHVEVDYHFIREKVLLKDITISYLSTHDQCADIFTKGLTAARFLFLRSKLMIVAPPISLRGGLLRQ